MSIENVFKASSARLSELMELAESAHGLWEADELAEIWREQLKAPLKLKLSTAIPKAADTRHKAASAHRHPPKTFGELLHGHHPPLELLKLTKDFAKIRRSEAEGKGKKHAVTQDAQQGAEWLLPVEIATLLYLGSIAVALMKCGERITSLNDRKLREGLEWAIAQEWVDSSTRRLFEGALKLINVP